MQGMSKYKVIVTKLTNDIKSGVFTAGDKLPSESELMLEFNVSRITVRGALSELANKKIIYKMHGKGCFVADGFYKQSVKKVYSYTDMIIDAGMTPKRRVITSTIMQANKEIAKELQIKEGSEIFALERIYYANDRVISLSEAYVPAYIFKRIEEIDFNKYSLYEIFYSRYNIVISNSNQILEAVSCSDDIYLKSGIKKGTALLYFNGVSYANIDDKNIPIEVYKSYLKTDIIKLTLEQN